jgi:hypothetical protein
MGNTRRTRTRRTPAPADSGSADSTLNAADTGQPTTRDVPWTIDRIHGLGATTDLRTAGAIFGLSKNTTYDLLRRGEFPVPVLRVGARYRVPVPAILAVLGAYAAPTDHRPRSDPEP